jgi:hypothetical protein
MTDDELKALVASLAESQKITDQQIKLNAIAQKATDEQIKRTDEQMKRTDEQMKRTDEQLKRTDKKLERIGITLGNIGQNQGAVAEEFFYNSLKDTQTLAGIHYDFIDKNISRTHNGVTDEYDMILINGQDIAIIEVKYKAHEADLTKLITKKYSNFKSLFPAYKDYRHHLVLATFHLYDDLKEQALQNNVIVLQRKGDMVQSYLPR